MEAIGLCVTGFPISECEGILESGANPSHTGSGGTQDLLLSLYSQESHVHRNRQRHLSSSYSLGVT